MEWKPITLPADTAGSDGSFATSWQSSGKQNAYIIAALTSRNIADTAQTENKETSNADTVIGYLISRGAFALPERAIRISETGRRKWSGPGEYRVPAPELLMTAKAFCEYCEVYGEFPDSKTWKTQRQLFLDVAAGKAVAPVLEIPQENANQAFSPDLQAAPSMFSVFDEPLGESSTPANFQEINPSSPDYFPATPFTLVTDARADEETGHEFVLHFDPEEERYNVFFFAEEHYANLVRDEFNEYSQNKWATVVRFDPRSIEPRFGVRYTDAKGNVHDMSIEDYRRNMEMRNEFRRED